MSLFGQIEDVQVIEDLITVVDVERGDEHIVYVLLLFFPVDYPVDDFFYLLVEVADALDFLATVLDFLVHELGLVVAQTEVLCAT